MSARAWSAMVCLVVAAGCSAPQPKRYVEPNAPPIRPPVAAAPRPASGKFEVIITDRGSYAVMNRSPEAILRDIVPGSVRRDLTVEAVDARLPAVVLTYTGDPSPYLDCGRVQSAVKTAQGEHTYDFPAAKASMQYEVMNGGRLFVVDRRMTLNAKVDITFEPLPSARTKVVARVSYQLTRDQTATAGDKPMVFKDTIAFKSGETAVFPHAATRCQSVSRMETDALEALRQ